MGGHGLHGRGANGPCYLTWFAALRRLPPATASVATLLTPIIGVAAAALALGEPLGVRDAAASARRGARVALWSRSSQEEVRRYPSEAMIPR